ncbi:helix-turn-helix transcriptional regulator [Yersinia aldovae]|uniref:Colanic acid capsular biosynthesis activation protein A n=1 Tax=Yersinia aldovae TaxID=29483 RepID=A0ABM9SZ52_YERAL|nr:LuxR C-terminal-related transcriptional regulator [Yersinia aldovae]CNL80251.1 colanic acid capsular biosynthesis activation protein A [Yersinia aldovae]
MIRIGLLGHCHYTRVALSYMLTTMYQDKDIIEIIILDKINAHTIRESENLDYLIVSGYQHISFHYSLKVLLGKFFHNPLQLIVLTEPQLTPLIAHFFAQYCHGIYFIRLSESCIAIQQQLREILFSRKLPNTVCISIRSLLTRRELEVMKALFSGVSVRDLCVQLSVSEKTISTHKSRAQDKLQYFQKDIFHHIMLIDALQIHA